MAEKPEDNLDDLAADAEALDADFAGQAPKEEEVDLPEVEWPYRRTLRKAVKTGSKTIQTLELREPMASDLAACGMPVVMYQKEEGEGTTMAFEIKPLVALKLVARLADLPPSSVRAMDSRDLVHFSMVLFGFFSEGMA